MVAQAQYDVMRQCYQQLLTYIKASQRTLEWSADRSLAGGSHQELL